MRLTNELSINALRTISRTQKCHLRTTRYKYVFLLWSDYTWRLVVARAKDTESIWRQPVVQQTACLVRWCHRKTFYPSAMWAQLIWNLRGVREEGISFQAKSEVGTRTYIMHRLYSDSLNLTCIYYRIKTVRPIPGHFRSRCLTILPSSNHVCGSTNTHICTYIHQIKFFVNLLNNTCVYLK